MIISGNRYNLCFVDPALKVEVPTLVYRPTDVRVKCQWLSNIASEFSSSQRDKSKVNFYWKDSKSPEKGFRNVCWRSFSGSQGGCTDHQFLASNNDTMLIKNIKNTGDVKCKFQVYQKDTLDTNVQTVTVKGRLSILLYKQTNCHSVSLFKIR